ncbi:MAG: nitrous oxide-stimulated promoter family protein [Chloroflexota bacterium]|nr:nitrous oxide-stimulated promoter family protein [Chloroflexota bacterium]
MTATEHPRMKRERRTIGVMVAIYCRQNHGNKGQLCAECSELQEYALLRLDKCPFQEEKTTCANCAVHCYKPERREQIREVMRFAGPRMIWRHPYLAMMHILDGRKKEAELPARAKKPALKG